MSFQDYLSKLNFGNTSDSINAMKNEALEKYSNPLELQYESLQSKIGKLTGLASGLDDDKNNLVDKVVEGITSAVGGGLETGGLSVGLNKFYQNAKNKFKNPSGSSETSGRSATTISKDSGGKSVSYADENPMTGKNTYDNSFDESKGDIPDGENPNEFAYSAPYEDSNPQEGNKSAELTEDQKGALDDFENGLGENEMAEMDTESGAGRGLGGDVELQDMGSSAPSMEGRDFMDVGNASRPGGEFEMQDMGSSAPSMEGDLMNNINDTFSKTIGGGEFEMQDLGNMADNALSGVSEGVENAIGGLGETFSNAVGSVSDAISNFGQSAISNLGNLFGGGGEAVSSGLSGLSDAVSSGISGFMSNGLQGAVSGVSKAVSSATSAGTDAIASAGEAAGAGEEALTAGVTAGIEGGLEVAGAGLEAVPVVGQVLGTLLMLGGAIFGGVEAGENEKIDEAKEADEEKISSDEVAEAGIKTQELTEQAKLSNMQFTGSNVIGSLSSIFNQGTTATAF